MEGVFLDCEFNKSVIRTFICDVKMMKHQNTWEQCLKMLRTSFLLKKLQEICKSSSRRRVYVCEKIGSDRIKESKVRDFLSKLRFSRQFRCKHEVFPQFSINMSLKPCAKFPENSIKALRERTIWNFTLAANLIPRLVISSIFLCTHLIKYSKPPWCKLEKELSYRRKTAKN